MTVTDILIRQIERKRAEMGLSLTDIRDTSVRLTGSDWVWSLPDRNLELERILQELILNSPDTLRARNKEHALVTEPV